MARFILKKAILLENYARLKEFGEVSFSFKTNPLVGRILEDETDSMLSVHFINELELITDKSRVWFLSQAMDANLASQVLSMGVRRFVIENEEDLKVLLSQIRKERIELLLRLRLKENTIRTERFYAFGMEADSVIKNIELLRNHPGIARLGIHFHRKTQNVSEWDIKRDLAEILPHESLSKLDCVNIGGGLPASYKNISNTIMPSIFTKLRELKEWLGQIDLIIEPGRYLSASCIVLETSVVGLRRDTIVVDASVYNASPDTLIVPIKLLVEGEQESGQAYIIKGITPCSTDIFRYRVYFEPTKHIKIGDTIRFLNAGAYNFHTDFCELSRIETKIE